MASSSSSSEPEAPHHRGANDQQRARLDELAEARHQFDEDLALLRQELGLAIDNLRRKFLCRGSPVRGLATGATAARLRTNRMAVHLHGRRVGRSPTTTNVPTQAPTSMRTLTLTLRHSFGGRLKTSPLQPCCYMAAQSLQPPRNKEYANSGRHCSKLRRRSKWRAPPRTSAPSAGGLERHPPTA
jgi:hypothetical protein